jgi:TMEM175 potassium channel family protein
MADDIERAPEVDRDPRRMEAFSDAVMAVIITILALGLHPIAQDHALSAIPVSGLLIYVLAFTFIAIYWNNHHHLLRATTRISGAVMWTNMLLLFCLSLIPFVTEWLRAEWNYAIPAASFGVVALASALAYYLLAHSIIRANGRDSLVAQAIDTDRKGVVSIVMYAAGVALAFIDVWLAYALYAAVAVMWLIPDRRFTRRPAS